MSQTWEKFKIQLILGYKILHLVYQSSPQLALHYFVSQLLTSLTPAINIFLGKLAIDQVLKTASSNTQENVTILLLLLALTLIFQIVTQAGWALKRHSYNLLKDIFGKYAMSKIATHTSSLDIAFFENPDFHDKLEKVQREMHQRPFDTMNAATNIIGYTITLASLLLALIPIAWWAPLIVILVAVPRLTFRFHFAYYTYSITDRRSPHNRQINQLMNILLGKASIHEVKVFNLKDYLHSKFESIYNQFLAENSLLSKKGVLYGFLIDSLSVIVTALLHVVAFFKVINKSATIGDLILFINAISRFQQTFADLSDYLSRFYENSLFLSHYFEFLELKPQIVNSPNAQKLTTTKPLTVEFNNVTFSYSPDKPVLKNITFKISPGKNIALIGENGAGKTTLTKLLLRLYDVTEGQILINGINIKEIELESLRDEIGVIFQNFKTYDMTVTENIGFGDVKHISDTRKIREAAKLANADTFIEKFPDKYQTMLGKQFAKGEELSGGQWQKIALARAFFKNAKVLIMDEPTSALDPKSEYEVFKNLIAHTKNRSLILISHRFSTVRLADDIIVLHDGQIVEHGTHEQLTSLGGKYAKLYALQAKWYK